MLHAVGNLGNLNSVILLRKGCYKNVDQGCLQFKNRPMVQQILAFIYCCEFLTNS